MTAHWKKLCRHSLVICLLAAGMTGCTSKNESLPSPSVDHRQQMHNAADAPNAIQTEDARTVADHLESLAKRIEGVRDANCVVFGKYAIVGIDVDAKLDRSRVGTIKYSVAEAFRKDRYGIDALVTADVDLAQRLREIRADIMNGRPIAGFAEELSDIVGRLVPQMPRSIVPPMQPENENGTGNHEYRK